MEDAVIDPDKEDLILFRQAAELVSVPVSMHTVRNWALRGAHGVRLDFLKIGARFYTSQEALQGFLDQSRENGWRGVWNGPAYDALLEQPELEG